MAAPANPSRRQKGSLNSATTFTESPIHTGVRDATSMSSGGSWLGSLIVRTASAGGSAMTT